MSFIGQFTFRRGEGFRTVALTTEFKWVCPDDPFTARVVNALFPVTSDDRGPQAGQPGCGLLHRAAKHFGGEVLVLTADTAPADVVF